jgi:hypothetical protein
MSHEVYYEDPGWGDEELKAFAESRRLVFKDK